jgi:4-amino-4-deoxy-L-arabinose transferase-like glycosyltransferase
LLGGAQVSAGLTTLLSEDADSYTWVAATTGAQSAASYQLATEQPVMALGGFNGTAASPTLARFQQLVAEGRIHYFLGGGSVGMRGGQGGTSTQASQIAAWVSRTFAARTVDGVTVYDLTRASTAATTDGSGVNA